MSAKNQKSADEAKARMEAAGIAPATIAMIVQLILAGLPGIAKMIDKLFKHRA